MTLPSEACAGACGNRLGEERLVEVRCWERGEEVGHGAVAVDAAVRFAGRDLGGSIDIGAAV